jgi:hypothetical protein
MAAKKKSKPAKKSPPKKRTGELRDEQVEGTSGGAFEAYLVVEGTKQGKL